MWISERSRYFGEVDQSALAAALAGEPESLWDADVPLKERLAGDRQTQSIFLQVITTEEFVEVIRQRPLVQKDVPRYAGWAPLNAQVQPLIDFALSFFPAGGVVLRVQLARMQPGSRIEPHIDSSVALRASHRLHVPVDTNPDVHFDIDGERTIMEAGRLYELNNRVPHWVENRSSRSRTHLIIDYLCPEQNNADVLLPAYDLKLKEAAAAANRRQLPPPRSDVALPKVLTTSVIRGANQDESHGGVYLVDLQTAKVEQVVDWNTSDIDFSGRGWDRGLRGIGFFDGHIYIAASNELFCFDQNFNIVDSYRNPYLKHAHEVSVDGEFLYITSTGFDSILRFDLVRKGFDCAWLLQANEQGQAAVRLYRPVQGQGPQPSNTLHLNNVFLDRHGLHVSGRQAPFLFRILRGAVDVACEIPQGTHNARRHGDGFLFNDTVSDRVVFTSTYDYVGMAVPRYAESELLNINLGDEELARQAFGRGLCEFGDGLIIAGSSPSTVSVYDLHAQQRITSVNISRDIRNAIHGLEIWPY